MIGTIYRLTSEHTPELAWRLGRPLADAAMVAAGLALHVIFKRRRWL